MIHIIKVRLGMERKVEISMLIEIYGKLLTEKQLNILDDYYNMDLSLSEIAENNQITRQAVRDIIKKGEKKLFEFEEKLQIMRKMLKQEKQISNILSELTQIEAKFTDEQIAEILEHIKKELNCLV
ncbi:MAG: putative DNA-binding protein [Clostridia bacterium]